MSDGDLAAPEVLETGVPDFDRILGGGLLHGAIVMLVGTPGTGKTILAQQIVFHHASRGESALYLTGYSETHDKLLSHSRGLNFFRPELISQQVHFASLPDLLREGAEETEEAIVATARAQDASLVVLDGYRSMRRFLGDNNAAARFVYSIGAKLALLGATTMLLLEGDPDATALYPELTVCDVIVGLHRQSVGSRDRRVLHVLKARGSAPLTGSHPFVIDQDGLRVYPRFESVVAKTEPAWNPGRVRFGIADLDALVGGGLNTGTATLVAGSPGVGKTTLSLHFVAESARAGDPALFLGFMESPSQLREKVRAAGMSLREAEAAGLVRFLVLPGYDMEADAIAALVTEDIERRGVRRLVIDSAAELERALGFQGRIPEFLSALVSYLRGREVTTLLTLDVPLIVGPELQLPGTPLSVLAENLLLLRQVEYRGRLHQVLSVLKMRFSAYERAIHEFTVSPDQGLRIIGRAPLGEGLLTGVPRVHGDLPAQGEAGGSQGAPWPRS